MSTINVRDFGAKGDGVTDDHAAVQAALAAAGDGGTVYFPSGTYVFSKTVEIDAAINIVGGGE